MSRFGPPTHNPSSSLFRVICWRAGWFTFLPKVIHKKKREGGGGGGRSAFSLPLFERVPSGLTDCSVVVVGGRGKRCHFFFVFSLCVPLNADEKGEGSCAEKANCGMQSLSICARHM